MTEVKKVKENLHFHWFTDTFSKAKSFIRNMLTTKSKNWATILNYMNLKILKVALRDYV